MGHLKGNKFCVKLRDTDPSRIDDVRAISKELSTRGVPNYFGVQRFGNRGDTWQVGRALLLGDFDEAAAIIAGKAGPKDTGRVLEARELFDQGRFVDAAATWPRGFNECVRVCNALSNSNDGSKGAVMDLDRKTLKLYVSAYQSQLFNEVLARRIENFDKIENGDLAWKHINGAAFVVEDSEVEAPRAKSFEISATGPLFGPKMTLPKLAPLELEEAVLADEEILRESFAQSGPLKCPGGRRPLRFKPADFDCDASEDEHGSYIELRFTLPSGCYATSLLREVCKDQLETVS
jgi:tRNA pseudouridine13 synthase